jgi:hypothetical protein
MKKKLVMHTEIIVVGGVAKQFQELTVCRAKSACPHRTARLTQGEFL